MPDAERLAALHARAFTVPRPWDGAEIAALLASPHVHLCHESEGFLIGRLVAGEAEVLTLAVEPTARRQGIGTRLLAAWHQLAVASGAEHLFLEVAADNAAAIGLYTRAGYRASGRRKGYYHGIGGQQIDAIVMTCDAADVATRAGGTPVFLIEKSNPKWSAPNAP